MFVNEIFSNSLLLSSPLFFTCLNKTLIYVTVSITEGKIEEKSYYFFVFSSSTYINDNKHTLLKKLFTHKRQLYFSYNISLFLPLFFLVSKQLMKYLFYLPHLKWKLLKFLRSANTIENTIYKRKKIY